MNQFTKTLDLNCDLGEASTPEQEALEARMFPLITSVNIACGVHAGSPELMRKTVALAVGHGVAIGAHPGLRDPTGHGRREISLAPAEAEQLVREQVAALSCVCISVGSRLAHVKPHGALYNMAARDRDLALAVAHAVASIDKTLILVGLAGSELLGAGRALGLSVAGEAFADRAYRADGQLVPRDQPGAVITDEATIRARVVRLATEQIVETIDGRLLSLRFDTLCLHGDTPGADRLAVTIRDVLARACVRLAPLTHADS
jgi:UPF0271 protein